MNSGTLTYCNCLRNSFRCCCTTQAWGGRVATSGEKTQSGAASWARARALARASGLFIRYGRSRVAGAEGSSPTSTHLYTESYSTSLFFYRSLSVAFFYFIYLCCLPQREKKIAKKQVLFCFVLISLKVA